jgi:hypothetical protein
LAAIINYTELIHICFLTEAIIYCFCLQDDKPLDINSAVELKDDNQTLTIKGVKPEAAGRYRCEVKNKLAEVQMAAAVNVTG